MDIHTKTLVQSCRKTKISIKKKKCNNTVLVPKAKVRSLSCHLPRVSPPCLYLPSTLRPPSFYCLYPLDLTSTSVPVEPSLRFLSYYIDV